MADQNPTALTLDHDVPLGGVGEDRRLSDSGLPARFHLDQNGNGGRDWVLTCSGNWNIGGINEVDIELEGLDLSQCNALKIDSSRAISFDTAGAWMIERLRLQAVRQNIQFVHYDADIRRSQLVEVIEQSSVDPIKPEAKGLGLFRGAFDGLGRGTLSAAQDIVTAAPPGLHLRAANGSSNEVAGGYNVLRRR